MLDKEQAKILEKNILERIEKSFPNDDLVKEFRKAAIPVIIMALQEYEKISGNQKE